MPLLSDVESEAIRAFGVLNTSVSPDDTFLYGIPYPGVFVIDGDGRVTAKFFYDSYKKRDSAEMILDVVRGGIELDEQAPKAVADDDQVGVIVAVHGGRGTIRQGVMRKLLVRFELADGLHIYDAPVPEGMFATTIEARGPAGLVFDPWERPPTTKLRLRSPDVELNVWSGTVDFFAPFYGVGELVSEVRPLDADAVDIEVEIKFQACDEHTCLLPQTRTFTLTVPIEVVDVPALQIHMGHGQREGGFDAGPHMKRLVARKVKARPASLPGFVWRNIKMNVAAFLRARRRP